VKTIDASTDTAAPRVWEFARRIGVDVLFENLGSDHLAFIEAFAESTARVRGLSSVHTRSLR